MRTAVKVVVAALLALALLVGLRFALAPLFGGLNARDRIHSGDNRIASYEHFFDLCASIQGMEGAIKTYEAELEQTTDEKRRSQLIVSIAGLRTQRLQSIARYNTDAQEQYTRGQFRDSDLPYHINPEGETTCGS